MPQAFDVDDWFARQTFAAEDFDTAELAAHKAAQQTSVSVVLPAFNEATTIGGVITSVMAPNQLASRLGL